MGHHEEEHHLVSYGTFVLVWLALVGFTGLTVATGKMDLGAWNFPLAMTIASTKCIIVLMFFMHIKYEDPLFGIMVGVCVMTLAAIFTLLGPDVLHRLTPEHQEKRLAILTGEVVSDTSSDKQEDNATPKTEAELIEIGKTVYTQKICATCHSTDGKRLVGPSFKNLYGYEREVLVNNEEQKVVADADYIKSSIMNPNEAIAKGYPPAMPPAQLTDVEFQGIVAYMKSLSDKK